MTAQAPETYVSSRRIGDATITAISEGILPWDLELQVPEPEWRRAMPEADERGFIPLGLNVVHVHVGPVSLVIDPGLDDPDTEWQRSYAREAPGLTRTPGLDAGLALAGIDPGKVTHVLITHAHKDHYCGVAREREGHTPRFPNARYFLGRADWDDNPERFRPDSDLATRLGALDRLGLLDLVEVEQELALGVTAIPTPGESPGHTVYRVHSGGETFLYVGDLFHHPSEVEHPDWVSAGRDPAAVRTSRRRIYAEAADTDTVVVSTHARFPPWGRIVRAGPGYRWQGA
jgi:glyoxylase-like metal-dependent hydrolase (beta-lactamase superfamily II)